MVRRLGLHVHREEREPPRQVERCSALDLTHHARILISIMWQIAPLARVLVLGLLGRKWSRRHELKPREVDLHLEIIEIIAVLTVAIELRLCWRDIGLELVLLVHLVLDVVEDGRWWRPRRRSLRQTSRWRRWHLSEHGRLLEEVMSVSASLVRRATEGERSVLAESGDRRVHVQVRIIHRHWAHWLARVRGLRRRQVHLRKVEVCGGTGDHGSGLGI